MRKLILPKSPADLLNPDRMADLKTGMELLNAFQNLKLVIQGGGLTSSSTIQVSGKSAVLAANINQVGDIFDPTEEFTISANPNSVWQYGYMDGGFSNFTLLVLTYNTSPFQGWMVLQAGGAPWVVIFRNVSGAPIVGIPVGALALHPLPVTGNPGCLRWTSPNNYSKTTIVGEFLPGDVSITRVAILRGRAFLFRATDKGKFSLELYDIALGDTLDFIAYGTTNDSSTPIILTITGYV